MPTPTSISSSGRSKVGLPAAGTVQLLSAIPIAAWPLTRWASSRTATRSLPSSAAAPTIFSSSTVTPTPRRPAVQVESSTATSSRVTTVRTPTPPSGGQLAGHLEVHDVAGVVLHDVQHAGASVDDGGRLRHLVGRG